MYTNQSLKEIVLCPCIIAEFSANVYFLHIMCTSQPQNLLPEPHTASSYAHRDRVGPLCQCAVQSPVRAITLYLYTTRLLHMRPAMPSYMSPAPAGLRTRSRDSLPASGNGRGTHWTHNRNGLYTLNAERCNRRPLAGERTNVHAICQRCLLCSQNRLQAIR